MLSNKLAVGSLSLGQHASHSLDEKIRLAAQHGFSGIEVVYSDLERYSKLQNLSMLHGAEQIRELCERYDIDILSLAPFKNFEGHDSPLEKRLHVAQHWIDIARKLKASYLQVPAQYGKACIQDPGVIISELQQLADLGTAEEPIVAIAYEPMSWSIHNSTWEAALQTINAVNRSNFGLCLDCFHVFTKLWASPFTPTGKYPTAGHDLKDSLTRFRDQFPIEKLFFVQLSDAERFDPPFSEKHPWYVEGEAPEFTWSKHARPFPLENEYGAYLPVGEFLEACVVQKGFKGWVSLEVFDRRMRDETFEPKIAAARARGSWAKLLREIQPL